jgi:hypothetical protein
VQQKDFYRWKNIKDLPGQTRYSDVHGT